MYTRTSLCVLLAAVALSACGDEAQLDAHSGVNADSIVGGASFGGLPAVGALTYDGQFYCTGTLITPRKVLTAAHCVHSFSPISKLRFVIGARATQPDYVLEVAKAEPHPGYRPGRLVDDVGLVTLAEEAPVPPLPVLAALDDTFAGKPLLFVGYGLSNGVTQTGEGIKRAAWIELANVAAKSFSYSEPGHNTCNGDSGGPAFYRQQDGSFALAGITSYGDATCTKYGVSTRADVYLDFLQVEGVATRALDGDGA